jgi:hypothetical protein
MFVEECELAMRPVVQQPLPYVIVQRGWGIVLVVRTPHDTK